MTPGMEIALQARRVLLAGLVRIELPGHTIRLCDGSAAIDFGGEIYTGRDALYGTIGNIEVISEQAGDTTPGLTMTLQPPSLAAAVALCQPENQDAPLRVWLAVVDADTGVVVPDPELLYAGEIDTADLEVDRGAHAVALSIPSVFERLFEPDEAARLSDSQHQRIFPGELGLSQMTGTPIVKVWGPGDKPPAATIVAGFPSTGAQKYF